MSQDLLTEVIERLARIEETGKSTLAQATKTNGRVTDVERRLNEYDTWRSNIMGKITVIGVIITGGLAFMWEGLKKMIYGS